MKTINGTPIFVTSVETKTLIELLEAAKEGEVVSFDDMKVLIGRDPRTVARGCLQTARRHLERRGIVFAAVRALGVVRLDDKGVVLNSDSDICAIRRKANRGFQRVSLGVKDYAHLQPTEKIKFNANASILGMVSAALNPSRIKKLEAKVQGESGALPLQRTLDAFKDTGW